MAKRGRGGRRGGSGRSSGGGSRSGSKGSGRGGKGSGRGKSRSKGPSSSGKKGGGTKSGSKGTGGKKTGGPGKSAPSSKKSGISSISSGISSFAGSLGFGVPTAKAAPAPKPVWHAAQTGALGQAIAASKEAHPTAWSTGLTGGTTLSSYSTAYSEGVEKSFQGRKFTFNPSHVTASGGFDVGKAASGFFSFTGFGLMPGASAQQDTKKFDGSTGAIEGTNTFGWGDVGGLQAARDTKAQASSDLGYVGDVNLAMPASAYSSNATGNELQLPTGEGSTIGGLSNLLEAAEGLMSGPETKPGEPGIIPMGMLGAQGISGHDAWSAAYRAKFPGLSYIPKASEVGVKVDPKLMKAVIKDAKALTKLYDQGVHRTNPDGTPNEKVAKIEGRLKLMMAVTGQLVNVPGHKDYNPAAGKPGTIIGYKPPSQQPGTPGMQTGYTPVVAAQPVKHPTTGQWVFPAVGYTLAEQGLAPAVKQVLDPKTGYMVTPEQSKEDIAKRNEIVGGPDAVPSVVTHTAKIEQSWDPKADDFGKMVDYQYQYDPAKDTAAHASPTGFDAFMPATPKTIKYDATGEPLYRHVGPEGNIFESTQEFLTKDSTPDKQTSVFTTDAEGNQWTRDDLTLAKKTPMSKEDASNEYGFTNVESGWDATKVMKGEFIYIDRPSSEATISGLGKGPPGHDMVKPTATVVSTMHLDPKTGTLKKPLTDAEKKKLGFTTDFGITTYNVDGSIFSEMKQPHVGSAAEWAQLGGSTGVISAKEEEFRQVYTLGGWQGSGETQALPWNFGRDMIEMVDTNEDGTPDMLQIVPYKPQQPSPGGIGEGFGEGTIEEMGPVPYEEPSPYEVPYYVDIEKATEMLEGGMTIDQILQHPPLDEGYMYWTDPTDSKEYVMSNEDYQEYLQAVAHQKKVEKQQKYEDVFMDVTRSMHRPQTQIRRRRSGAGAAIGRRMASDAPSEANIGGLVK